VSNAVLIYDGDCAFCTLWVTRLRRWLPRFPDITTSQTADLEAYGLSADDVRDYVWLVTPTTQRAGAAAFSGLLRGQRHRGWAFLGHLLDTWPVSVLADLGYKVIAKNRHRLPGATAHCEIPRERG
jgi:predicted DCC family thiol-disulfide oxidoreductase YuxK